ncbi:MAG TPA: hypothetical protein VG965_05535 [Patescibacteria group bacterium]|nr:hypothetical protein [Patescibacteria group bacterium]
MDENKKYERKLRSARYSVLFNFAFFLFLVLVDYYTLVGSQKVGYINWMSIEFVTKIPSFFIYELISPFLTILAMALLVNSLIKYKKLKRQNKSS